jgi:hypothetical protein
LSFILSVLFYASLISVTNVNLTVAVRVSAKSTTTSKGNEPSRFYHSALQLYLALIEHIYFVNNWIFCIPFGNMGIETFVKNHKVPALLAILHTLYLCTFFQLCRNGPFYGWRKPEYLE